MPADRIDIDVSLVRRLVDGQFPQWTALSIEPCDPMGWDNYTYRLGDDMKIRMPSAARYAAQTEKEHRWLPKLAPRLPLPIPAPLVIGEPADRYPWPWSISRWIEGDTATLANIDDLSQFATDLAQFLVALQQIDSTDGPPAGTHNFFRGEPLTVYDAQTKQAIDALGDRIDVDAASAVWEAALKSTWTGPPVWVHGDVSPGNLLVIDGRLSAVIDFGSSGVGDPACDLAIAWTLFAADSREAFRAAMGVDDGTWMRGCGWALWKALITLAGDPVEANGAFDIITGILTHSPLS